MNKLKIETTSFSLHIIGMVCMLLDHMWATILPQYNALTCIGRIAFPIFAFMVAKGARYTSDLNKYIKRMLVWAIITEIPFDLMVEGVVFYPFHNNVLWTFLIALLAIKIIQKVEKEENNIKTILTITLVMGITYLLGYILMVDYYGAGIVLVLGFYLIKDENIVGKILQFALMYYVNLIMLGGYEIILNIGGKTIYLPQQAFAMLALIFIYLYKGKQGYHSKGWQFFCYAFYPLHCLILALLLMLK